ncbi:hypothetical protein [Acinetobacter colistiniresistens]|uniref:hypothetical protein n=1 Tax=Acinetobacter colistiniresistens TaxID=280145 RepID=UPI00124FC157|nr:hypothetical protein [Acinetobacter colistiniresistens]
MKAIFAGGSFHAQTKDIINANPTIQMTPENGSSEKESFTLFEAKNKDGVIYALYKHKDSTQKQVNEILLKFN